ncbi:uncharacterized protein [Nicotiana tomentosiformis]|uniref:uncharacterized protein n=1 Tax=Nicotiana tomentosiformis TaxID=4098 RepID=UPI00388C826F
MAFDEAPSRAEGMLKKDSGKVPESLEIEDAPYRSQQTVALALHQEEFSKSRTELNQREADFRGLSEERNALKLLNGQKEEEIKDLRAELAKAYQDQTDLTEQADDEAAQVQEKRAAETTQTQAYWVAELAKCQSRRETLEGIHARGFDLTKEIKKAKELEGDAGALASYDDDDDVSKSGSESRDEPDGEETAPGDNQET